MQRHRNIKVKGIIVGDARHEEHQHQQDIVPKSNVPLLRPEFLGHHESFQRHKGELAEGDQIAGAGVMSEIIAIIL